MKRIVSQTVSNATPSNEISFKPKRVDPRSKLGLMLSQESFSKIYDLMVRDHIDSWMKSFKGIEKEVFKYLAYYWKKFDGNIEVAIKNIMDRFKIKRSWCHEILKRIYDKGLIVTTGGGYGQKVTKRTFTERGKIVYKAITAGVANAKQVIPEYTGHYTGHYSQAHTNNISSKVDILQGMATQPDREEPEIGVANYFLNLKEIVGKELRRARSG